MGSALETLIGTGMVIGGAAVDSLSYVALNYESIEKIIGKTIFVGSFAAGAALIGTGLYLLYRGTETKPIVKPQPPVQTMRP